MWSTSPEVLRSAQDDGLLRVPPRQELDDRVDDVA